MTLHLQDVQRVAYLARLSLTQEQEQTTLLQLNEIFLLVDCLQQVDTQNVLPLLHPTTLTDTSSLALMREDVVIKTDRRDNYQRVAPNIVDGLYLVPQVIE